jgi:subtilisin family serine protease
MNASPVHRQGTTGRGVKVAMIDSSFYIQHPYYLSEKYNMSRILAPDATNVEHDESGHGTAEAANILAIAPDVTFIGVKAGPNLTAAFKETAFLFQGDLERTTETSEEAAAMFREQKHTSYLAYALNNLGWVALLRGSSDRPELCI